MDFMIQADRARRALYLPQYVKARPIWLKTMKDRDGAYKIPVGRNGAKGWNNPANWYSFEEVQSFVGNIGVCMRDGLCCLDFDKVLEPCKAKRGLDMISWVTDTFGETYTELSNSGKGIHMLFYCDSIPDFYKAHKTPRISLAVDDGDNFPFVEIFPMGKFVALTGNVITSAPVADFSQRGVHESLLQRLIPWTNEHKQAKRNASQARRTTPPARYTGGVSRASIERALSFIPCRDLTEKEWTLVGMAIQNDGLPVDVWDAWSRTDPDRYKSGECQTKWRRFHAGKGVTGAMIYGMAKDHGWKPREDHAIGYNDVIGGEA